MIIFVAGIHGVGKTFLGAPVAQQLGIRHATASQLIRKERGLQSWGADKRVSGLDENQAALVSATKRLHSSGQNLLLDGHFVLRGTNGAFNEIDPQVFRDLQIGAVLLLEADTDVVIDRLRVRGDTSWSPMELRTLAAREEAHARHVSSALGIAIRNLLAPGERQFGDAIKEIIRNFS
jgi:adenylate kinase